MRYDGRHIPQVVVENLDERAFAYGIDLDRMFLAMNEIFEELVIDQRAAERVLEGFPKWVFGFLPATPLF